MTAWQCWVFCSYFHATSDSTDSVGIPKNGLTGASRPLASVDSGSILQLEEKEPTPSTIEKGSRLDFQRSDERSVYEKGGADEQELKWNFGVLSAMGGL